MRELMRSNDLVLLSYVEALLKGSGIAHVVADQHISAVEGSIGALPRRVLVDDDDLAQARELLQSANLQ
jgi:hypothetical protein